MNEVNGFAADGFGPVADAYRTSVGDGEGGSALNIRVGGKTVVDLWAGLADRHGRSAWARNTPTVIFSCTKGLVPAILAAMLVGQGRLGLDRPVADYWPEFGAAGKEAITVRQLLSHRAGLAAPREDISLETALDWPSIVSVLASQEPLWKPGTAYGYHALTYGWYVGEVIRRITGTSVGARSCKSPSVVRWAPTRGSGSRRRWSRWWPDSMRGTASGMRLRAAPGNRMRTISTGPAGR